MQVQLKKKEFEYPSKIRFLSKWTFLVHHDSTAGNKVIICGGKKFKLRPWRTKPRQLTQKNTSLKIELSPLKKTFLAFSAVRIPTQGTKIIASKPSSPLKTASLLLGLQSKKSNQWYWRAMSWNLEEIWKRFAVLCHFWSIKVPTQEQNQWFFDS